MDELLTETNFEDLNTQQSVAFNLGDLKKEEEILNSLLSKMKDQLNKLEVEELELKQKIRRKELKETTAELFPPPPPVPDPPKTKRRGRGKGKGGKPKRKQERTSSVSHDEGGSELDDTLSITSALSQPSPISVRSVKLTPTRRSPRIAKSTESPDKYKSARALTIPDTEPENFHMELDLSALNSLSLPELGQSNTNFIESDDEL